MMTEVFRDRENDSPALINLAFGSEYKRTARQNNDFFAKLCSLLRLQHTIKM